MAMRPWGNLLTVTALFVIALPVRTPMAQFVEVCGVPLAISGDTRQSMENRREALLSRQVHLIAEGQLFNLACGQVAAGSAKHRTCADRFATMQRQALGLNAEVRHLCMSFWRRADEIAAGWALSAMVLGGLDNAEQLQKSAASKSWSDSGKTGFMLATMAAMRGYYARARLLLGVTKKDAGEDDLVRRTDALLQARALAAAEHQARNPYSMGGIDETAVDAGNAHAQRLVWTASMHMGRGEYERAVELFQAAKGQARYAAGTQAALNKAIVWARQLRAARGERHAPGALKARYRAQREQAAAERAWQLGHALALSRHGRQARKFYDEAHRYFAGGSKHPASVVARQRRALMSGQLAPNREAGLLLAEPVSRTAAVLDALEYGKGDWHRAQAYLETRLTVARDNRHLREALAYVQGLSVEK